MKKKNISLHRFSKQHVSSVKQNKAKYIGRLAQLVQSICLTSRGSAVRIRQRPPKQGRSLICSTFFIHIMFTTYILFSEEADTYYVGSIGNLIDRLYRHSTGRSKSQKKECHGL